ncbi:MAG: division/cell wall cluster transcriptional repressor MraZ [Tissierellia bacterium]|nr:division/cell wall cluster transcriptional repressor MraZ [Tissierellia bacterium]
MYIGEYIHSIDSKGRVIMPQKFRDQLGPSFFITRGIDGCLFVYDESEWQAMYDKMKDLKLTSKKAREFSRFLYAPAREVEVDKQGRIIIPQNLREYADIKKEVAITGVASRIEIWSKERYDQYNIEKEEIFNNMMDEFEELDI